jgi:hypothetical protein
MAWLSLIARFVRLNRFEYLTVCSGPTRRAFHAGQVTNCLEVVKKEEG